MKRELITADLNEPNTESAMIGIRDLKFQYNSSNFRLEIKNLDVRSGTKLALIGPSGCGKTTLLHLLSGVLLPTAGSIRVCDQEVSSMSDSERRAFRITRIGFVFQTFELLDYLNVLDNILLPPRINSSFSLTTEVRHRARELASDLGLTEQLSRRPGQLSQGERQRVAICRALLPQPALLLADEPTGNLDPTTKQGVLRLLFDHAQRQAATLIVVTHDHSILDDFDEVIDFRQFYGGDDS